MADGAVTVTNISSVPHTWDSATFTWGTLDANKTWDTANLDTWKVALASAIGHAEAVRRTPYLVKGEAVSFAEGPVIRFALATFAETYSFPDTMALTGVSKLSFNEPYNTTEAIKKTWTRELYDEFTTFESYDNNVRKKFAEASTIADSVKTPLVFLRSFGETLASAETPKKTTKLSKQDLSRLKEQLWSKGNAVISDLVLSQVLPSFSGFVADAEEDGPPGLTEFRPFIPGDYDLKYAFVKVVLSREGINENFSIDAGKFTADVPDVRDGNTTIITSTAAPTEAFFSRTFIVPPTITVSAYSGSEQVEVTVSDITTTSFKIRLRSIVTGNLVAGSVTWSAEGY